ncbi:3-hydroxyisobutyrate dehydrogenase, variant [Rhizodiscina lignyota]|uniref:3-hydroxyisobutyrate dehydrogenase n=1 Tax=Rhizodiscina lignyota TaxID=1504668 RepID=A0A9P4I7R2_9PEZI|nr:3-hydroxyisobutyrate dehydrogenase, variant [Rhizodiscina lignyota]
MADAPIYGFIGIGNMGYGMATNLRAKISKSSKLIVCELDKARRDKFISEASAVGPTVTAETPKEIAEQASIIITMLPNGAIVKSVFTNPTNGLLAAAKGNTHRFFLECSTIEVSISREVLEAVKKSGLGDFIDSPVSGGIPAADKGTLTFMVGGPKELYEKAKPILSKMGKEENIIYCGDAGAGLATKQINNYMAYTAYIALCEGMNAGVKFGLDPKILANVINVSSGVSWNSLYMNPVAGVQPDASSTKGFKPGFTTELAKGVIDMAVQLMDEVGAKHVLANVTKDVYTRAVNNPKCAKQESRSTWRLIAEDDGKDLGNTVIQ